MPKIVIAYSRSVVDKTFPASLVASLEMLSSKIDRALTQVILDRMKGRKNWDESQLIMEADLMPVIVRNRMAVEVEITATDGVHWHDTTSPTDTFVEDTQKLLNEALLNVLVSEGLAAQGWSGSVWLMIVPGSFGDTNDAAQRLADVPQTLPLL